MSALAPRALVSRALLALALLASWPGGARASLYDVFGFNPRGIAMGNALTAGVDDYSATYYNPAALTLDKRVNFGFGLTLTFPDLYIDRGNPSSKRASILPEHHAGITLGWQYPIGGIFKDQVALGISAYLPTSKVIRVEGADPQTPQFYLYNSLHDKIVVQASLAYEPWPWISFGVGGQILADIGGGANLSLNILGQTFDRSDVAVTLQPSASFIGGVHARPLEGLSLGLSWRSSSSLSFTFPVAVTEGRLLELDLIVSQTVLYTPPELSFGLSYRIEDVGVTMAADTTVSLWSDAPDPSPRIYVDFGGTLLEGLGLGDALDVSTRTELIDLAFVDTVTTRLGFEWETLDWLRLRTGYFFRPTPAPRADGVTAYLDNDAHVISLGAGFIVFDDPLKVHTNPISIDVAFQVTVLPRRTVLRRDELDPVGDLSHGGALWTLSAHALHRY